MNIKGISAGILLSVALLYSADVVADADTPRTIEEPVIKPAPLVIPKSEKVIAYSNDIPLSKELQTFARIQSELNGVPYVLTLAVMEQESRFDIHADGGDSFGLMQINICHGAREIIEEPHENIKIGCWLLGYLHREYRDWNKALVAYNCGEAGAEQMYFRHGSISSPYSREVMFRSERFAQLLNEPSVLMPK